MDVAVVVVVGGVVIGLCCVVFAVAFNFNSINGLTGMLTPL